MFVSEVGLATDVLQSILTALFIMASLNFRSIVNLSFSLLGSVTPPTDTSLGLLNLALKAVAACGETCSVLALPKFLDLSLIDLMATLEGEWLESTVVVVVVTLLG